MTRTRKVGGVAAPDLSGMTVPTADTIVEGARGDVTYIEMSVDPLDPSIRPNLVNRFSGEWRSGFLRGEAKDATGGRNRFRIPVDGLVMVNPGWSPDGSGDATRFSVGGRCMSQDAAAMEGLLTSMLREHVRVMSEGYATVSSCLGTRPGGAALAGPEANRRPDGFYGTRHHLETLLPPGRYWVGDPCLAMSRESYLRLIGTGQGTRRVAFDGGVACVSPTAHGDGTHYADRGRCAVESGQLGILSADLVDEGREAGRWGIDLDCPLGVLVGLDMGRHAFGIVREDGQTDWMDVVDDPSVLDPPGSFADDEAA